MSILQYLKPTMMLSFTMATALRDHSSCSPSVSDIAVLPQEGSVCVCIRGGHEQHSLVRTHPHLPLISNKILQAYGVGLAEIIHAQLLDAILNHLQNPKMQ